MDRTNDAAQPENPNEAECFQSLESLEGTYTSEALPRRHLPFGNAMKMPVALSDAVAVDISDTARMVWVSGQLAINEQNELVGKNDMAAQTEQVLDNIERILSRCGGTLADVVNVTVFVRDMANLKQIHEVRLRRFKAPYPASTLVRITDFVNPGALIEIAAQAVIERSRG